MSKKNLSLLKILLVDDEPFIRKLVSQMLMDLGVTKIIQASDGAEALRIFLAETPSIDMILLDLEMPKIGGFNFLKFVRSANESSNSKVPVIVLTGHSQHENITKAAKLGIHGFLVKPVSKAKLILQIKRAMNEPMIDPTKIPDE